LLIKFIDARHDLSLQVHPGEEIARSRHGCSGKTEMWYIIDSAPGSTIISGFSTPITRDQYRQQVAEGKILDSVAIHPTHPGDVFFIPSGRVHAIGAGNFLLEVQQSSDITYRIYDYDRRDKDGNPRQLHTELAVESIDYRVHDNYKITPQRVKPGMDILVQCPVFDVRLLTVTGKAEVELPGESFLTMTCVKGQVTITADGVASTLSCGHTLLIPAETSALSIDGNGLVVTANC
jgi:mannose-6-phosphate isomerase